MCRDQDLAMEATRPFWNVSLFKRWKIEEPAVSRFLLVRWSLAAVAPPLIDGRVAPVRAEPLCDFVWCQGSDPLAGLAIDPSHLVFPNVVQASGNHTGL